MALIGDWEVVCNYADEDVDYLELEIRLENDFRLQRQILLAREDEFLLISDIVLGTSCQRIDYRLELELPSYMSAVPETETTEVYLSDNKIRALVVPLALPEWRDARTDDRLSFREHRLELCQSTLAKNLYAGIFLDLNAKRSKKPRTWRKLTVAEQLEIVSAETAVAFRVQVGNGHWLIYRALDSVGNRSFIGQNHSCEFFVGRFRPDGDADELLSIE